MNTTIYKRSGASRYGRTAHTINIGNSNAEFETAAVKVQGSRLEHGLAAAGIELTERHEIIGQCHQVTTVAGQAFNLDYRIEFRLQGQVLQGDAGDTVDRRQLAQRIRPRIVHPGHASPHC